MEYWEFLLQKEGDQAWLPLESAQVEILEGRYRVMAHSSQLLSPVRVRISQLIQDQATPRRRLMKRTGETNEAGLMVVMPFTWLNAGIWEIHCADDSQTGNAAGWQYAIQLRVLPQEINEGDEWFPEDWTADSSASEDRVSFAGAEASSDILISPDSALISQTALVEAFGAIDQALSEAMVSGEESAAQGLVLSTTHRLELAQSAFMVNQGQVLMVVGQVKAVEALSTGSVEALTLALRLLDPQSGTVITMLQHPLEAQPLPAAFAIPVTLPVDLETRLLLGELILVMPAGAAAQVKALQRFTVTVDLVALFDAIANQAETDENLDIVFPPDPAAFPEDPARNIAGLDLAPPPPPTTDLPEPPPRAVPTLLRPKVGLILPPKIHHPDPPETGAHEPTLPFFQTKAAPKKRPAANPADETDSSALVPTAEPQPLSLIDSEFRTLNLQERFWSRLNSLAIEAHEATARRQAELQAARDLATPATDLSPLSDPWEESFARDAAGQEPFAGEVVIYEDPEEPIAPAPIPEEAAPETDDILSPPPPMLEVPEGELRSGDRVSITLRIPYYPNRLYLKVWITDPQTRTLADEPRQITNLSPDGQGNLEGSLQLMVPMGCLEAWFEAIAVDMVTQQESYKTSVSRTVIPPEISTSTLDEFDL
ncbi:hypothetical protein [Pseudanabaena sp. FACHB-2040]|uniref:hypothetical protein n=1 Tax=Pseudanabaena sp. FACHB-2040 TaxID=2692859 RepID=UPI0016828B46|nr:hypothetical protein [Pseudanabaena sp. FACHB-2040]MBD2258013.1 hypothetical protein [Pseudanabaena sp. FACHB-2040]